MSRSGMLNRNMDEQARAREAQAAAATAAVVAATQSLQQEQQWQSVQKGQSVTAWESARRGRVDGEVA